MQINTKRIRRGKNSGLFFQKQTFFHKNLIKASPQRTIGLQTHPLYIIKKEDISQQRFISNLKDDMFRSDISSFNNGIIQKQYPLSISA